MVNGYFALRLGLPNHCQLVPSELDEKVVSPKEMPILLASGRY
jgi:hypothetical protein